MEDPSDPLEASPSNAAVKRSSEADSSGNQSGDLSMPICFLVKEQAKSHVAIQDLQKRVESIENIQNDVIDSLAEIRKFLVNDSKATISSLRSLNASSEVASFGILKTGKIFYSPSNVRKSDAATSKECSNVTAYSPKQLECKAKEAALESDKQDSGLDSDQLSLNRQSMYSGKQEPGDELLQLLDEISVRTEVLQKQLSDIDPKSDFVNERLGMPNGYASNEKMVPNLAEQGSRKPSSGFVGCSKQTDTTLTGACMQANVGNLCNDSQNCFEGKFLSNSLHKMQKKAANKIDSAIVSSILKETSVVDLQRQVLIYLVENAVLHTKVTELSHLLSSKSAESSKVENSLRDESRLLMMENRELRISLDEQKLETNSLRSKLLMMERVLSSISVENKELTWQLSEFLGIQSAAQKQHKLSSSYTFGDSKASRRFSLPSKFSTHNEANINEANINCVKSRLLSNASSFLDVTMEEEPTEPTKHGVNSPCTGFDRHSGPMLSSTPIAHHTKLKDIKMGLSSSSQCSSNFQSIKKRFKPIEKEGDAPQTSNMENGVGEFSQGNMSELSVKNLRLNNNYNDACAQFPFNTILEKLKANSDYRLLRSSQESAIHSPDGHLRTGNKAKLNDEMKDSPESRLQSPAAQGRKGKNIHQRIQKILNNITSE